MTSPAPFEVSAYALDPSERAAVSALLDRLETELDSPEAPEFLADARRLALAGLPVGLTRFLDRFRRGEAAPVAAVTGLKVDDARVGPTPPRWDAQADPDSTLREEAFLVLLGSALGDVFGWDTLQGGRLVHNVVPIRLQERTQSGHGSLEPLAWHTEDGFHPWRCDYLGLMALRNHGRVPTTVATVNALRLSPAQRRVLAQPRFVIHPDDEHLHQRARERAGRNGPDGGGGDAPLPRDWTDPAPVAVLFGDLSDPYLRIDPYFMAAAPGDREAAEALAAVVAQLDAALWDLVLEPGMVAFIDNYRAVHGRQMFEPSYDGRDRWLKKVVVTRDLRRSRAARERADARVLRAVPLALGAADGDAQGHAAAEAGVGGGC